MAKRKKKKTKQTSRWCATIRDGKVVTREVTILDNGVTLKLVDPDLVTLNACGYYTTHYNDDFLHTTKRGAVLALEQRMQKTARQAEQAARVHANNLTIVVNYRLAFIDFVE